MSTSPASTSRAPRARSRTSRKTLDAARAASVQVIYFQNGWDKDYVEAGGPGSPNYHKSNALRPCAPAARAAGPAAVGTWDYAIVDELQPQPGDILVPKTRYSGFFNTNMDSVLRAAGIAISSSSASLPTSASRVRCAMLSTSVFRRDAGGRDPSPRARFHPAGDRLQRREILRLGRHRQRFLRRHLSSSANRSLIRNREDTSCRESIIVPEGTRSRSPLTTARHPTASSMSPARCPSTRTTMSSMSAAPALSHHVLEIIKSVIETAGGTMEDVTMNHIFVTDWANYQAVNAVYAEYFPGDKPARYCVSAAW